MNRRPLLLLGVLVVLAAPARASTPSSGTISPATPSLGYTAGPFLVSNASGAAEDEPICVDGACDTFALTIDVPADYAATHRGNVVTLDVHWTDVSGQRSDFDVFVYDANGNRVTAAATANDPEVALIPPVPGTYIVHVIPFRVSGESIAATLTLGPAPSTGLRSGVYHGSSDVFSCNNHLTGSSTVFVHDHDAEPAVKVDANGTAWITSNPGLGGDQGMWQVDDGCGHFSNFIGGVATGEGGGDTDVEVAPEKNAQGFYNVYTASLYLANITTATSMDGGHTFVPVALTNLSPVNDREWLAAYGASTVYLSYRSLNNGNQLFILRSDAAGAPGTWAGPIPVFQDLLVPTTLSTQLGPVMTDRRPVPPGTLPLHAGADGQGNVYHPFILGGAQLYLGVSHDFGVTWHSHLVYQAPSFVSLDHIFCWGAVDQAGNVYVAFSTDHDIYYCSSTDVKYAAASTWSAPVRVSNGLATKTAIFPAVDAGSAGRLVFTWYGSDAAGVDDPAAKWNVFHARTNDALDAAPVFEQIQVSDHVVRTGSVCEGGTLGCSGDTRDLLDDFEIAVSPVDGSSFITYTDDSNGTGTWIARELAGTSALADRQVVDRSTSCPRAIDGCQDMAVGNPCTVPGVLVGVDPAGDETGANTQQDIESLSIAEPSGAGSDRVVFTMKVNHLEAGNLPPNSFWRITWTGPDSVQRYVRMLVCATDPAPAFDYGHFTTGSVTDGVADDGSFDADGSIHITMLKSHIGSPQPGGRFISISGDSRDVVGNCPGSPAAFAPVDAITATSYTVVGSGGCPTAAVDPPAPAPAAGAPWIALRGANPFSGSTRIAYALARAARARIEVYDVTGQRVRTLANRVESAGEHELEFALAAPGARPLAAGVYLVRLSADGADRTLRVVALH